MTLYLDNHTVTHPLPLSIDAMLPFFHKKWGSLRSFHQMGDELYPEYEKYRTEIVQALGASPNDALYFFSCRQEAMHNLHLAHYLTHIRETGKNHIVQLESENAFFLESLGCHAKHVLCNEQGQITKQLLEKMLLSRVSLVSIPWADPLTGAIHPIADLAEACHEKQVLLHVDASHVIGKHYFRFEDLPIDYLTFDGSLLHAPKGIAGLIVKEKSTLSFVDRDISMALLSALSTSLKHTIHHFDHMCLEIARLRDYLEKGIVCAIPDAQILCEKADRLPNCTAIAFTGVVNEALLFLLNRQGLYATMGKEKTVSFSLSLETTQEEIERAICIIVTCVNKLKKCSYETLDKVQ